MSIPERQDSRTAKHHECGVDSNSSCALPLSVHSVYPFSES